MSRLEELTESLLGAQQEREDASVAAQKKKRQEAERLRKETADRATRQRQLDEEARAKLGREIAAEGETYGQGGRPDVAEGGRVTTHSTDSRRKAGNNPR